MIIAAFKLFFSFIFFVQQVYSQTNSILVKNPDYIKSYGMYLQGDVYYNKKLYDRAIHEYRKAIKIFSQYPENYYKLSKIYLMKQEFNQLESTITTGMKYKNHFKDKADLIDFLKTAADYYEKINNNAKALDYYLSLIKVQSNFIYQYKSGVLLYKLNKMDDALDRLTDFKNALLQKGSRTGFREEYKNCLKILVNINSEKNNYIETYELLKEIYIKYPEEDVLDKLIILSNNLKYYQSEK